MNTISVSEGADGAGSVLARHPGGRPVKWTPEAIEAEGEALLAWLMEDESRFWVKSFATERGYSPQRFSEWVKVSPEFSEAYEIARGIQESRLLHMGLRGRGQSMAIFALKVNHGWRDVQEVQQTSVNVGVDITEMSPDEARNRVQRLLDDYDSVQPPELPAADGQEDTDEGWAVARPV